MANKVINLSDVIVNMTTDVVKESKKMISEITNICNIIETQLNPSKKNSKNIDSNIKNIEIIQEVINPLLKIMDDFDTKKSKNVSNNIKNIENINELIHDIIDILYTPKDSTKHIEASGLLYNINELNSRIGSSDSIEFNNIISGGKLSKNIIGSLEAIKAIVDILADLVDKEKNPLIGNPISILMVKIKIKKTFRYTRDIIKLIQDELLILKQILSGDIEVKNIKVVIKEINSIIGGILSIITSVIKLQSLFLKFIIAAPIALKVIELLHKYLEKLKPILDDITNIKFDEISQKFTKIKKDIENTQNAIENIISLSKFMVTLSKVMAQAEIMMLKNIRRVIRVLMGITWQVTLLAILMPMIILSSKIVLLGSFYLFKNLIRIAFLIKRLSKHLGKDFFIHIFNIKFLIWAIKSICLDIVLLALVIIPVVLASIIVLIGMALLWLIFMGIIFFVNLIGKRITSKLLISLGKMALLIIGLVLVTTLIVILAIELLILQMVAVQINVGTIVLFLLGMVVLVVVYAILGLVAFAAAAVLLPGAVGILVTVVILIILTAVLIAFAAILLGLQKIADKFDSNSFTTIASFLGGVIVLAAAYTAMGVAALAANVVLVPAMVGIMALIGSMVVITTALMGLAKSLEYLQSVEIDKDKIINNVNTVLEAAEHVTKSIESAAGEGDQIKGGVIGSFFRGIGLNDTENEKKAKSVLGKYELSFDILKDLTEILEGIQEIELQKDLVLNNVDVIFACADEVLNKIEKDATKLNAGDKVEGGFLEELAHNVGLNDTENEKKMKTVLGKYELSFDVLRDLVDILKDIQAIKLESDPVLNNVDVIFACADDVCQRIAGIKLNEGDEPRFFGFGDSENEEKIEIVMGKYETAFAGLKTLVDTIRGIQEIKLNTEEIKKRTSGLFDTADLVLRKISENGLYTADLVKVNTYMTAVSNAADAVGKFNQAINKTDPNKTEQTLTAYDNFLKRIGDTDLNKLRTTTQLFKEMAKFSESIHGNFDMLAHTINEEIMPLLKELKEIFDKVEKGVKENNEKLTANTTVSRDEIKADMVSKGQDRGLTEQEVNRKINAKFNEAMRNNNGINELISKMSELIYIFREGSAKVKLND